MMKLIVVLLLATLVVVTRKGDESFPRRYSGFILVSLGVLICAGVFDALGSVKDFVGDALYRQVILWSTLGFLLSVTGFVASLWCRQKLLKISTMLLATISSIMCAAIIVVPY